MTEPTNTVDTNDITYDEIISSWYSITHDYKFDENIAVKIAHELITLKGTSMSYENTYSAMYYNTVSEYSGNITGLNFVINMARLVKSLNKLLYSKESFTPEEVKLSHRLLMKGQMSIQNTRENLEFSGAFKKVNYSDENTAPRYVWDELNALCQEVYAPNCADLLKLVAKFCCEFLRISPFSEGNDILCVWLMNYLLLRFEHPPIIIESSKYVEFFDCVIAKDVDTVYSLLREALYPTCLSLLNNPDLGTQKSEEVKTTTMFSEEIDNVAKTKAALTARISQSYKRR